MELLALLGLGTFVYLIVAPAVAMARAGRARQLNELLEQRLNAQENELARLRQMLKEVLAAQSKRLRAELPHAELPARPVAAPEPRLTPAQPEPLALPAATDAAVTDWSTPPEFAPRIPLAAPAAPADTAVTAPYGNTPAPLQELIRATVASALDPPAAGDAASQSQGEAPAEAQAPAEAPAPEPVTAPPIAAEPAPTAAPTPPAWPLPEAAQTPLETPPAGAEEPPNTPGFDLENLIGVRFAAWIGAIALAVAGTLFAKYSIENDLIPPVVRIAFLILLGTGAIVGSETFLRKRYAATANPVCGGGIAVLYAAFFAAHALYDLIGFGPTFGLMVLTTALAALLSIRYDSVFIAVLGLLGGFATPLLLSSGQDRPIGLFGYVLLLDLGFLWVAARKNWHRLVLLSLAVTLILEVAWAADRLTPAKLPIGLGVFFVFGMLYLLLPSVAKRRAAPVPESLAAAATVAGLTPLLFALCVAGSSEYAGSWAMLFGYIACLDAALLAIGIRRQQMFLPVAAALATAATVGLRLLSIQGVPDGVGAELAIIGLAVLLNLGRRIYPLLAPRSPDAASATDATAAPPAAAVPPELEWSGLIALLAPILYALVYLSSTHEPTLWKFLLTQVALLFLVGERSRAGGLANVAPIGGFVLAVLAQIFVRSVVGDELDPSGAVTPSYFLRCLSVPLAVAVFLAVLASLRSLRAQTEEAHAAARRTEIGAVCATLVGALGHVVLLTDHFLPLTASLCFAILGLYVLLLLASALRRTYSGLITTALVLTALYALTFDVVSPIRAGSEGTQIAWLSAYTLLFFVLPLALATALPRFRARRSPFVTAALAGPLLFLPIYIPVADGIGRAAIGALPLVFALVAVLGLAWVQRMPPLPEALAQALGDEILRRRRLGNQALFAAVALGFVALAIPLQLDRQWITVGWALEAAAVWWLYRRLPHPGLKYFGLALLGLVTVRLIPDAALRHYQERGHVVFNWLLYTYGVPSACFLIAARGLQPVEELHRSKWEEHLPVGGRKLPFFGLAYLVGLLEIFVLINLEIADAFSTGSYVNFDWEHDYARDLITSMAWGLYGLVLLGIGMWRQSRALRFVSMGFMLLTIAKVFLYDLSNIHGIYRPLSFLGLAVSLILVSLLYQRFVFRREPKAPGR